MKSPHRCARLHFLEFPHEAVVRRRARGNWTAPTTRPALLPEVVPFPPPEDPPPPAMAQLLAA